MGRQSRMQKHLAPYCGDLNPEQIAEGMNAAAENAARLHADAEILLRHGSFASAAALAILSIEESGKISILRGLATAGSERQLRNAWREYRSHTAKNVMWIFPFLVASGRRYLDEFDELFASEAEHPAMLDAVKQVAFYTDCLGKAHWSRPSLVIDESNAKWLVKTAEALACGKTFTPAEVRLWIEYMRPTRGSSDSLGRQALIEWHLAMWKAGLTTVHPDDWKRFVMPPDGNIGTGHCEPTERADEDEDGISSKPPAGETCRSGPPADSGE